MDDREISQKDGDYTFEEVASQGRLHGQLARKLAVDILNGVYQPGDILPHQLARQRGAQHLAHALP